MQFLADDLLEGRGTGTRGYALAAKYMASEFEGMGLEPTGDNGGYFQSVRYRLRKNRRRKDHARSGAQRKRRAVELPEGFHRAGGSRPCGEFRSDYFARNPTVAKSAIVANVNMDEDQMLWPLEDIIAFGAEHSSLQSNAQRAAERMPSAVFVSVDSSGVRDFVSCLE